MNTVQIYGPGQSGVVSARTRRELSRIEAGGQVAIARIDQQACIQEAQVDAVASVAQRALQGVAFVTQMEQQLAQAVPLAASRLQAIGDLHALASGQIVTDTVMRLRRCR
jgi:hypothetical protein